MRAEVSKPTASAVRNADPSSRSRSLRARRLAIHCVRDIARLATLAFQASFRDLHPTIATAALATAGLPVVVVHPRQARDFARATGQLAKTDALDARALAHFADVIRPTPLPDAQTQELRALLGRRQPRIGMRTAEQNRLAGTSGRLAQDIEAHIA